MERDAAQTRGESIRGRAEVFVAVYGFDTADPCHLRIRGYVTKDLGVGETTQVDFELTVNLAAIEKLNLADGSERK